MGSYAKTPTVFQMEASECGAASLSMVFAYFGRHMPPEQVRMETGVSRDGCSAGDIMRAARKYGLECRGFRKKTEGLRGLTPPCILHWAFNHFVVFEGFKGGHAYINDPAAGRRRLSFAELDDGFTGVVLTFRPTSAFVKEKRGSPIFTFVRQRLAGKYGALCGLILTGLLLVLPGLLLPLTVQVFLDSILAAGDRKLLTQLILFMCGAVILQAGLALYRGRILARFRKKTVLFCVRDFLTALFRLPIRFFDRRYPGDLAGRVDSCENAGRFLADSLADTVPGVFASLLSFALLLAYSPALTAIAASAVLVNVLVSKAVSKKIADASVKLRQDGGRLSGAVCAGIGITAELKAFGGEDGYARRVLDYNAEIVAGGQSLGRSRHILDAICGTVNMLAGVLILLAGASFVISGDMTIGMLAAFSGLYQSFPEPARRLAGSIKDIQTVRADIGRTEDILCCECDEKFDPDVPKAALKTKLEGAVELRDVSFGYNPLKPPLLSGFDFKIPCGSSIAFVGASGSGKSTLLKVIGGLYRPWSGQVLFDGIPAGEVPGQVRNVIVSSVGQKPAFFPGTVRDNLTMWNANVSEADMTAAAKDACIHDWIVQKPGGYNFRLSEGASNLSGGQRQRLEIARALAPNPAVLLLDEATSALDPIVEKQILDNIKRRGCTCVIAAHRLSTVRDCDEILVMDSGRIIERGSHEQLLKAGGAYRELMRNM